MVERYGDIDNAVIWCYDAIYDAMFIFIRGTGGASPRRADARLGSAHARNDRGCRRIEAVNATVLPTCTLKIDRA